MSHAHASILLAEIQRRARLRDAVAKAGFAQADIAWVKRSALTNAVAVVLGKHRNSRALGRELRQFLLTEGWHERRYDGIWQWRAKRVKSA